MNVNWKKLSLVCMLAFATTLSLNSCGGEEKTAEGDNTEMSEGGDSDKCEEGKCEEGKCEDGKSDKCEEGKCEDGKADNKCEEGKCGEGKCGGTEKTK